MSETKKLQQNEIEEVTNIRKNYFNIQNALGQIFLTRRNTQIQLDNLDKQEESILAEYAKTQEAERNFVDKLQETYGIGTLDIQKGEFVPSIAPEQVTDTQNPQ
jgi:hypothetical protein